MYENSSFAAAMTATVFTETATNMTLNQTLYNVMYNITATSGGGGNRHQSTLSKMGLLFIIPAIFCIACMMRSSENENRCNENRCRNEVIWVSKPNNKTRDNGNQVVCV